MTVSNPLVSVIIPAFNRAALIGETLESIRNQTYTNWECIVVDDHSEDNTCEVVEEFVHSDPRFKLFLRPIDRPKGANACRNYGFDQSHGELINWFDSDDLMHSDKLQKQVVRLQNSSCSFTVCQTAYFHGDINHQLPSSVRPIHSVDFFNDFVLNRIKWLTQAPLIERKFLLEHDLRFDETLQKGQERDFFLKMLDVVHDYDWDDTSLVFFRHHKDSISGGALSSEKVASSFIVNCNALKGYNEKLSDDARRYLINVMMRNMVYALRLKDRKLVRDFSEQLNQLYELRLLNWRSKLKLHYLFTKYWALDIVRK